MHAKKRSNGVEIMDKNISRRGVLIGAAAVAGVATLGVHAYAAKGGTPVSLLVTDTRFEESKRFAASLARSARKQLGVAGNVSAKWFGTLCKGVMGKPGTLTGLTTLRDFNVIKACATRAGFECRSERARVAADGRTKLVAWEFAATA
jgi:hypothetical protein